MATIDNLTLEITANSNNAIRALDSLATSLTNLKRGLPTEKGLKGATNGFRVLKNELSELSASAKNLEKVKFVGTIGTNFAKLKKGLPTEARMQGAVNGLNSLKESLAGLSTSTRSLEKIKTVGAIANGLSKFSSVKPSIIINSAKGISDMTKSLDGISNESITKLERIAEALSKIPQHNAIKSAINAVNKVEGKKKDSGNTVSPADSDAKQVVEQVDKVTDEKTQSNTKQTISLFETLKQVAGGFSPVFKGIAGAFKLFGSAIKKLISPITSFIKALGRIAFYRFIRGIIKGITDGLKTGIENLALYSKAMEELDAHSANNVMSRYASEFLYFKNAVATAVIPVLRALIPIIETAINRIIDFINVISQLGSAFFGTQFTKAKYFWVDYADSLDKASGSAKKLNKQLAQFDELNNLTTNQGGGGSDKLADASKMFEEAEISSKIKKFADKIKEVYEKIKGYIEKLKNLVRPYWERLKEVWNKIVEKVAPHLEVIRENIGRIWDAVQPFIEGFIEGFLDDFVTSIEEADLPTKLENIAKWLEKVTGKVADWLESFDKNKLKNAGDLVGRISSELAQLVVTSVIASVHTSHLRELTDLLALKLREFADRVRICYDRILNLNNANSIASKTIREITSKVAIAYNEFKQFALRILDVKTNIQALKTYLDQNPLWDKTLSLTDNLKNALQVIWNLLSNIKNIGSINLDINLQDSISSAVSDSKSVIAEVFDKNYKESPQAQLGKDTGKQKAQVISNPTSTMANPIVSAIGSSGLTALTKIKKRANGGYVPRGDLFYANERGAEMIGSVNGQTAVANNQMITEAIAEATYRAMTQALAENGMNVTIEGDAEGMFKVMRNKSKEYTRKTGKSAFA